MLTEKPECSQDTALVLLVRTRLIADKMIQLARNGQSSKTSTPPLFFMRALDAELQEIQNNISKETERTVSYASQLSIHHTQLIVWDSALDSGSSLTDMLTTDPARLEGLYKCLEAIKSWFDLAFKLPATSYAFPLFSPLTDFISALHKLSAVQMPGWSIELVRNTLDLSEVLQNLAQKFEQAQSQTRLAGDFVAGETYEKGVAFVKYMRNMVESRSTEDVTPSSQAGGVTAQDAGAAYKNQIDEAVMFPIVYSDDSWLTELLATVQY
ncbi:uncharacterized protein LDX57_011875 [Aspergillus melleus]|uniref:uncharacterized protein n=1 Tax=Aspergillus melleus TaxID=138277 RepID=UPI001E8D3A82|nr:uncharacterized protein LDX57_011875 [Aspergillus melleus]KAH8434237.1 hypothetical protein LDX57_011875 [Aspergillus melleus]